MSMDADKDNSSNDNAAETPITESTGKPDNKYKTPPKAITTPVKTTRVPLAFFASDVEATRAPNIAITMDNDKDAAKRFSGLIIESVPSATARIPIVTEIRVKVLLQSFARYETAINPANKISSRAIAFNAWFNPSGFM